MAAPTDEPDVPQSLGSKVWNALILVLVLAILVVMACGGGYLFLERITAPTPSSQTTNHNR